MRRMLPRGFMWAQLLWIGVAGCSSPDDDATPSPTEVPDKAPAVRITSPSNGASAIAGTTVNMAGTVTDDRDSGSGLLVVWTSDRDGELFRGNPDSAGKTTVSTSSLTQGTHTITLTGTDTSEQSVSQSITLTIKSATNTAPTASITSPSSGSVFPADTVIQLEGTVGDAEDAAASLKTLFKSNLDGELGRPVPSTDGNVSLSATLSAGAHEITLQATDSSNKTTTSPVIRIAIGTNAPPEVQFTGPDGTRFDVGSAILFSAIVTDDLTDASALEVAWSSSLDGELLACDEGPTSGGDVSCELSDLSVGEHSITLTATDGSGLSGSAEQVITVNGPPTGLEVSIEPKSPTTDQALTVNIVTPATDPNGDSVHYTYQWYRDDLLVTSLTSNSVPSTSTTRDEEWRVHVIPDDGDLNGVMATATVTIQNSIPTLSKVGISPTQGTNSTAYFCLPQDFFDADGDSERYVYSWLANGTLITGATGSSYTPGTQHPNDVLQCRVNPFDGTDQGVAATSAGVTLSDRAPSITSVQIVPSSGNVSTEFVCQANGWTDPDNDTPGYRYQWLINSVAGPTTATLSDVTLHKGDSVACRVTPYDGILEGDSKTSASITLQNANPTVTALAISPAPAYANSSLRCLPVDYSDPDNDPEQVTVQWKVDGVIQSSTTSALTSGFARGDTIECSAQVSDGESAPVSLVAAPIVIANAVPSITSVALNPPGGSAQTTFTALPKGYEDADGDAAQYAYQWYVNGIATVTTASIAPGKFKTGDTLRAEVVPSDGISTGDVRISATITVGSAANPPGIEDVTLTPTTAYETTTLTCTAVNPIDPEGDTITLAYAWTRNNGAISGVTTATLTGANFSRDDVIQCTVTPRDNTMTGAPVSSNKVTILNSKPSITKASITPVPATKATPLVCAIEGLSDADGDTLSVDYEWTVNGSVVTATGGTLSNTLFKSGDTIVCSATPTDRLETGTKVTSAPAIVQGAAPVVGSVALTPTSPTVLDTLSCQAKDVVDADGDTVTLAYQWVKGGNTINGQTSSTLSGSLLKKGDVVSCRVTPSAASQTGAAVSSNAVTVQNAAPTLVSVLLEPDAPTETSTLSCSPQTLVDADNDTLTRVYKWTVNSTDLSVTTSTLTGAFFNRGDQVRCTFTATDTSGAAVSAVSNSVTIRNSSPVLTAVVLGPEPAYVTSTLTCTPGTATDADGDAVGFQYAWKVNGTTLTGVTTAFLSASTLKRGDSVQCVATPVDDLSTGVSVASNTVVISNQPPVVTSVSLAPTLAYETSTLTCTASGASDPDNDTVTLVYSWYVDSVKISATTKTLTGTHFNKVQEVACEVTPNDGQVNGTAKRSNTVTIENSVPTFTGATLSPSLAYENTVLTCAGVSPSDADPSDTVTTRYAWEVDSVTVTGQTGATLTGSSFNKGSVVRCTASPYDGTAIGTAHVSSSVTILNTLPVVTGVNVTPTSPLVSSTLTCNHNAPTDVDAETPTVTYAWKANGTVLSTQTAKTLVASSLKKNDSVTCTVTPKDGEASGTAVESASVTIGNSAPVASGISVSAAPSPAREGSTLTCAVTTKTDPDNDTVTLTYAWLVNSTVVTSQTSTTLSGTYFNSGNTVACRATPNDGTVDGTAITSSAITIENTPPTTTTPTISPTLATAGTQLTCSATGSDVDPSDTVSLAYAWAINGTTVSNATSPTLSSGFKRADLVTCTVTPSDAAGAGTSKTSAALTISNTPPSTATPTLSAVPSPAVEGSTLTCTAGTTTDADGDSTTLSYRWYVNSSLVSTVTTSSLTGTNFNKNNTVYCEVVPTDGFDAGTAKASSSLTINNSAPTLSSVSLTSSANPPKESSVLTCAASGQADADSDTVTVVYAWLVNSSIVTGQTSNTLSGGSFKKGDSVACRVTPNDGTTNGTALTSSTLTINNTLPVVTTPVISPSQARAGDTLTCSATGSDGDSGDVVTLAYAWAINGSTVSTTTTTLSTGFKRNDSVTCTVTPSDGVDTGTAKTSSAVVILNSAPNTATPVLSASPSPAREPSILTCTAGTTTDADGDSTSLTYRWYVDSVLVSGATSSTLDGTDFDRDQEVYCEVQPSDGTTSGTARASNTLTISNSAPSLALASISPSTAYKNSTLICQPSGFSDADDDAPVYAYRWKINDVVATGKTSASLSGVFVAGDSVKCEITPGDGTSTGTAVESSAVIIGNRAPSITSVDLSPTTADATSTLVCSPQGFVDADGDTAVYTYAWEVEGITVPLQTGDTLSTGFGRGDNVVCIVTPGDGITTGPSVTSNTITIQNAAPSVSTLAISPTSPLAGEALTASATGTDPDGDSVSFTYLWKKNGVNTTNTTATVPSSVTQAGEIWTIVATPTDGTLAGTPGSLSVTVQSGTPVDVDADGFNSSIDCNDADATVYPDAHEFFDTKDNDCDLEVDERWALQYDYTASTVTPPDSTSLAMTTDGQLHIAFGAVDPVDSAFESLYSYYSSTLGDYVSEQVVSTVSTKLHRLSLYNRTGQPALARVATYDPTGFGRIRAQNDSGFQTELSFNMINNDEFGGLAMVTYSGATISGGPTAGADYIFYEHFSSNSTTLNLRARDPSTNALGSTVTVTSATGTTQGLRGISAAMGDGDAFVHLAWLNSATTRLDYRKQVIGGTSPTRVQVNAVGDAGISQHLAIAVQPGVTGAFPQIVYYDPSAAVIKKATTTNLTSFTTSVWINSTTLGGVSPSEERIAFRIDSTGKLHAVFAANNFTELWYATDRSGTLVAEKILKPTQAINSRALDQYTLVVDAQGDPYVSFPDKGTGMVYLLKGNISTNP